MINQSIDNGAIDNDRLGFSPSLPLMGEAEHIIRPLYLSFLLSQLRTIIMTQGIPQSETCRKY